MASLPDYIEILPDNFKVPIDPRLVSGKLSNQFKPITNLQYNNLNTTSKFNDLNNDNILSLFELNPLLLTAYLLNKAAESSNRVVTLEDFKRTYRLQDTIIDKDVLYQPEIYKGYLAFKSTRNDLEYYFKQIGLDTTVSELCPSGSIDNTQDNLFIDGSRKINNYNSITGYINDNILTVTSNISGTINTGQIVSGYSIIPGTRILSLTSTGAILSNSQTVPNISIKLQDFIRPAINDDSNIVNTCTIKLTISVNVINDGTPDLLDILYYKITNLLLNRLAVYTNLAPIVIVLNIQDSANIKPIETSKYVVDLYTLVTNNNPHPINNNTPSIIGFTSSTPVTII